MSSQIREDQFVTKSDCVVVIPQSGRLRKLDASEITGAEFVLVAQEILDRYESRFGNLDEISHPAFFTESKFLGMLNSAAKDGRRLTREDIEKVYPDAAWEW